MQFTRNKWKKSVMNLSFSLGNYCLDSLVGFLTVSHLQRSKLRPILLMVYTSYFNPLINFIRYSEIKLDFALPLSHFTDYDLPPFF